jgi:hypothetical protein
METKVIKRIARYGVSRGSASKEKTDSRPSPNNDIFIRQDTRIRKINESQIFEATIDERLDFLDQMRYCAKGKTERREPC